MEINRILDWNCVTDGIYVFVSFWSIVRWTSFKVHFKNGIKSSVLKCSMGLGQCQDFVVISRVEKRISDGWYN